MENNLQQIQLSVHGDGSIIYQLADILSGRQTSSNH